MELKDFLISLVSSKLKRERGIELTPGEFKGKTPDALLVSSKTVMGVILVFFDEPKDGIERRLKDFIDLGVSTYALVQKNKQKAMTDILWQSSLMHKVKVITWDIQIGF